MTRAFADEAVLIHEAGHLSDQLIARATGAAPGTVRGWLTRTNSPTGARAERVVELSAIVHRLMRVMAPEFIPVWMTEPVDALGNEEPLDLIARGEYRQVSALVRNLEQPGAV